MTMTRARGQRASAFDLRRDVARDIDDDERRRRDARDDGRQAGE